MNGRFPALSIPIRPPVTPMEARAVETLPTGAGWQYEPKWDGFRCLIFRDRRTVVLQAKNGEPLTRYFPELVMAVAGLPHERFALDGELVVVGEDGRLSHEELAQRIHPSARRVAQLSARSPARLLAFDLLAEGDEALGDRPLSERRERLEAFFEALEPDGLHLSPATSRREEALSWLRDLEGAGVDGVIAKRLSEAYRPGRTGAMVRLAPEHTVECVVGGLRRAPGGKAIGSLLLGLHDDDALLHFVGGTAPLSAGIQKNLEKLVTPLLEPPGFTGRSPGAETRYSHGKVREWEPLRPALVCEVRYGHFDGEQFRDAPLFLRFRPGADPRACTLDKVRPRRVPRHGLELIGL